MVLNGRYRVNDTWFLSGTRLPQDQCHNRYRVNNITNINRSTVNGIEFSYSTVNDTLFSIGTEFKKTSGSKPLKVNDTGFSSGTGLPQHLFHNRYRVNNIWISTARQLLTTSDSYPVQLTASCSQSVLS